MRKCLAFVLVAVAVNFLHPLRAEAAPAWALEYRYWQGFYGSTSFELRYEPASSPWGIRAWSAHGYDEDHCLARGECYHDSFWGLDLLYRVSPSVQAYLGYQNLYRDREVSPGVVSAMSHSGLRLGVLGTFQISGRLSGLYDVSYAPVDYLRQSFNGSPGPTMVWDGGSYRLALRYELNEQTYLEVGQWNWGFNQPGESRDFNYHIWLGPYVTIGMRFF